MKIKKITQVFERALFLKLKKLINNITQKI